MPFLVWDSPSGRVVFELTRSLSVLGREPGCDLPIEETSVSRRHALVELEAGKVRVTDLGSKGGTRINGADLVPDLPSTLDAGDFINVGRVVLTYHVTPPPPQAARPVPAERPKSKPRRERSAAPPLRTEPAAAPAAASSPVWKYVALGLAFVLVVLVGAVVALQLNARQPVQVVRLPEPEPAPSPDPEPVPVVPEPEPEPETAPEVEPEPGMPAADAGPSLAAPGALPPQNHASVDLCPDLIGMEGDRFYPVRLRDWDRESVKALGSDGRLYRFERSLVVRIEDRADLERRAAELRRKLPQEELQGRIALARWCARRFIEAEARLLIAEVLDLDSGNAEANAILASLGDA